MYDIIIENGTIYDGAGEQAYIANIYIKNGFIIEISQGSHQEKASRIIDATGMVVCPGFIDPHTHDDNAFILNRQMTAALSQGVTTEIIGLCGLGMVPCKPEDKEDILTLFSGILEYNKDYDYNWSNISEYLKKADGAAINVAASVGHSALRIYAGGLRSAKYEEIAEKMKEGLKESLEMGAVGLSIGLDYYPAHKDLVDTKELEDLALILKKYDSVLFSHIRYGGHVDGIDEMFDVAKATKAKIHVLHTKTYYPENHGQPEKILNRFDKAISEGLDITAEFYPYPCWGACQITYLLPLWVVDGSVKDIMHRLSDPSQRQEVVTAMQKGYDTCVAGLDAPATFYMAKNHPEYVGKKLQDICQLRGQSMGEMLIDLLCETELAVGFSIGNVQDKELAKTLEDDFMTLFEAPYYGIGSDSISVGEHPLPRAFGSFAKIIRLTREYNLPLEKTIYKLTKFMADRFSLNNRGHLMEGKAADIAIFDYQKVYDRATDDIPRNTAAGMKYVIVNGHIALIDERPNGFFAGKALYRNKD